MSVTLWRRAGASTILKKTGEAKLISCAVCPCGTGPPPDTRCCRPAGMLTATLTVTLDVWNAAGDSLLCSVTDSVTVSLAKVGCDWTNQNPAPGHGDLSDPASYTAVATVFGSFLALIEVSGTDLGVFPEEEHGACTVGIGSVFFTKSGDPARGFELAFGLSQDYTEDSDPIALSGDGFSGGASNGAFSDDDGNVNLDPAGCDIIGEPVSDYQFDVSGSIEVFE